MVYVTLNCFQSLDSACLKKLVFHYMTPRCTPLSCSALVWHHSHFTVRYCVVGCGCMTTLRLLTSARDLSCYSGGQTCPPFCVLHMKFLPCAVNFLHKRPLSDLNFHWLQRSKSAFRVGFMNHLPCYVIHFYHL